MSRRRLREYGYRVGVIPTGRFNTLADVPGFGVGHSTVVEGEDIRSGVTAITTHGGDWFEEKTRASVDLFNGYGKMVGVSQIINEGVVETPVLLTETLNTFRVADALVDLVLEGRDPAPRSVNPVVAETNGGYLTDNHRRVVGPREVREAVEAAQACTGPVEEGNVGGGTPMTGYGFKGGIGTSSRRVGEATLGALVQLNCGAREDLRVLGVPVGRLLPDPGGPRPSGGSIIMVLATDVQLESRQLWKLAKRAVLGLARTGSYGGNGSGDFSLALSNASLPWREYVDSVGGDPERDSSLNPLYRAAVEAVEEAVLNALFKAETMTGRQGHTRYALPVEETLALLERYHPGGAEG